MLGLLILIIVGYLCFPYLQKPWTNFRVQQLKQISNPATFALNIDESEPKTSNLKYTEYIWGEALSKYYPNSKLNRTTLNYSPTDKKTNCTYRRDLLVDSVWNVFWVEAVDCNNAYTYGPYRLPENYNIEN